MGRIWIAWVTALAMLMAGNALAADVGFVETYDGTAVRKMVQATAPAVEAAVSQPLDRLYAKAKSGTVDDKIRFALALFAGRDTSNLRDPAVTPANVARARAFDTNWYTEQKAVSADPSDDETDAWLRMTYREMWSCLPCQPDLPPEEEAKDPSYAAYVRLNTPDDWIRQAYPRRDESMAVSGAALCANHVALSLKTEAAREWLITDRKTATGRRARLNALLYEQMTEIFEGTTGETCAAGRFSALRQKLRAQRPELEAMVAAYLDQRLSDPRIPWGYLGKTSGPAS